MYTNHQNAEINESAMTFSNLVNIQVYIKSLYSLTRFNTVVLKSDCCYMEKP